MATAIRMPDVGTVEGEVLLSRWLKAEGDPVAEDTRVGALVSEQHWKRVDEYVKLGVSEGAEVIDRQRWLADRCAK